MNKRWTIKEEEILISNFPDIELVIKKTGRTIFSIKDKSKKLRLFHKPIINIWHESIPIFIKAYISGHFDGEGCVSFRKRKTIRVPIIHINIAHKPTLDLYKKYFNGNIDSCNRNYKEHHKKIYRWRCAGYENIYNFILSVIPYSIEKKEQLICAKDYIDNYLINGKKCGFSNEFKEYANELHRNCTQLKKQ
jgi:hypothetical protein